MLRRSISFMIAGLLTIIPVWFFAYADSPRLRAMSVSLKTYRAATLEGATFSVAAPCLASPLAGAVAACARLAHHRAFRFSPSASPQAAIGVPPII
jgi:hypothetical protein